MRVLLVEDDILFGELYQTLLTRAGFVVVWCRDNYDAIDALDVNVPDIIILDLLLPLGNGLQLLHELASHADLAKVPVLLCSSALPAHIDSEALRPYGVVEICDKTTCSPQQIVQKVREITTGAGV